MDADYDNDRVLKFLKFHDGQFAGKFLMFTYKTL